MSRGRLDEFFELSARGSTLGAEIRGGVVTFIAMAYIVVLNPIILSEAADVDGNRLDFAQVSAATSLAAGAMTILFGLIARLPFAFAAGLGINSFLATTVVGSVTWPEAMGLVVINGVIIVVLAATGLRTLIFDAVPMQLKLAITAGIGSDHVDLQAAIDRGLTVAEVTYSNSISVSEHVVMMILALVRNYIPSYQVVVNGGWNIADCVSRSYDLEGMQVGTVGAGRIGSAVLRRLQPFEVGLHYTDRHRLPTEEEERLGVTFHEDVESLVRVCDVVTINAPLHPETEHLFDEALIAQMKRGAYIVNTARGKICDRDAVARALESGQLAGYAGDVWFPQPAPQDHPWRTMPHHGMTPHTSGTSLSAQARYAAGTREILECWLDGRPIREEYLIVDAGKLAGAGAHSYSAGDATGGSDEAARFTS